MIKRSNLSILSITIGIFLLLGFLFYVGIGNLGTSTAPPSKVSAQSLEGKRAPAFTLTDVEGKTYTNESFKGKKVVLFFNEGLRCYPACWNAMTALGNDQRFAADGIAEYSIVTDSPEEWKSAAEKVPELRKVNVLFDANGEVSRAFGMLTVASSMHYGSLPGHTYLILDGDGFIRSIFDDPRMGVRNDEIAAKIETLSRGIRL